MPRVVVWSVLIAASWALLIGCAALVAHVAGTRTGDVLGVTVFALTLPWVWKAARP